jgi:electron transfer flavoprotein beta subunit
MKVLVALKRVADPDNADKVKVALDGRAVDSSALEWKPNPFDEYALEAALRLTENGALPKARLGEVVVVTLGPKEAETTLRGALATGADRAIRIDARDEQLDGRLVALALRSVVAEERPDLILMGKQSVDGENGQVGQRLAELLEWPMATFAATLCERSDGSLLVGREVDGGMSTLRVRLPALVTVDLRIVAPTSVRSKHTALEFRHNDGVRFAALPAIMAAKRKPLGVRPLAEVASGSLPTAHYRRFELPQKRSAGVKVESVRELVRRLSHEAKVI